jgi:RNA polymerase sigma-70 factor (ECF subfamily)
MEGTEPWSQQAAWQALLALRPRLRRFASGLTGSLDEADDLVQAVYERAVERHLQWQPGTHFHSWVFKIAHSLWISRQRHAAVRRAKDEAVDPDTLVGSDGERDAHARLDLADVRRLVAKLPPEQRAALMLVAVDGATYKEAAGILGVPAGTVASRVARARLALVEALEGKEVDAAPSAALARSG